MTLSDYQTALERHFLELSRERQEGREHRPVFALEHGLSETEVDDLKRQLRSHIAHRDDPREYPLAWVVYASEFGYEYDGDEYWQSFEAQTPGWEGQNLRYWLRRAFIRFTRSYHGVEPRGPWASHFSIICWPITHAVLPQDLQYQLARVLYATRHRFTSQILACPDSLGSLIAAHSDDASSRFRNLTQDEPLVGRIAAALLSRGQEEESELLLPQALNRIVTDLERHQAARGWLKQASVSAHSARIAGLTQPSRAYGVGSAAGPRTGGIVELGIEPRLLLRHTEQHSWEVILELPNLSPLGIRFPEFQPLLAGSRCFIAGSSGRPWPRGQILRSGQSAKLVNWPKHDEVLIRFEQHDDDISRILRMESLLRPGPIWLFKVGSDGQAREIRTHIVRPEDTYILLSAERLLPDLPTAEPATVECTGIEALVLRMPQYVDEQLISALGRLGLGLAKQVDFRPVGIVPKTWDGEGHVEWLSTDAMVVGVSADHQLVGKTVSLRLDEKPDAAFSVPMQDGPSFLRLPRLAHGLHVLSAFMHDTVSGSDTEVGSLEIVVTPPTVWAGDLVDRGALQVFLSHPSPSLEDLWEGRLQVQIEGPSAHRVHCTVSLFSEAQPGAIKQYQNEGMPLPLLPDEWHERVVKPCRERLESHYDRASRAEIKLRAAALGRSSIVCPRRLTPLRWIYCPGNAPTLRLSDDMGVESDAKAVRYAYERPDEAVDVALSADSPVCTVDPGGGLYVARKQHACVAVIVPPPPLHRLGDLSVSATIPRDRRGKSSIGNLLSLLELWSTARLPGSALAVSRRREAMRAILRAVFGVINGEPWFNAESCLSRGKTPEDSVTALAAAIGGGRYDGGLGRILTRELPELAKWSLRRRISHLAQLTARQLNLIGDVTGHVDFALRLASGHYSWRTLHGEDANMHLEWLGKQPMVGRAARFAVLAIASRLELDASLDSAATYEGWDFGANPDSL